MSDFGGQRPARALAYVTATLVGAVLVTLGTLVSSTTVIAALATQRVAFVIAFSRAFGGYVAAAQTGMLLSYVIAVSIPSPASAIACWTRRRPASCSRQGRMPGSRQIYST
ncbi:MAG: hypothetical protein ABI401_15650 [Candidatus Dormibacter sp.]